MKLKSFFARKSPEEKNKIYSLDELLVIVHPAQKIMGWIYFNYERVNEKFEFRSLKLFYWGVFLILLDILGNLTKIFVYIKGNKVREADQFAVILSIEVINLSRGLCCLFKNKEIAKIWNELDRIFPRTRFLQERMQLPQMARSVKRRFRYLYLYGHFGFVVFMCLPVLKYLCFYDTSSGLPVPDEYQQNASWFPFGLKDDYRYYFYMWIYESYVSVCGMAFWLTWDHVFTIVISQLCFHFKFLCGEMKLLNAQDTSDAAKAPAFHRRMKECIAYGQHLNRLGRDVNNIFDLCLLIADGLTAFSICFHLYLISNSNDLMSVMTFSMPLFILVGLLYDTSKRGTDLLVETSNIKEVLYNQNWYEGSLEYRKQLILFLQQANEPFKLTGFNFFTVDMLHYQKMMTMSYQLFAFLTSRN